MFDAIGYIAENRKKIYWYIIHHFGLRGDDAEDILHDVVIKVSRPGLRPKHEGWIYAVVRNTIYDFLEKKEKIVRLTPEIIKNYEKSKHEEYDDPDQQEIAVELARGREKVIKFIHKHYNPKISQIYCLYFKIYCKKVLEEKPWIVLEKQYDFLDMNTVRVRVTEIRKEFQIFYKKHPNGV